MRIRETKRVVVSKNKATVLKWAKSQGRKILWKNSTGIWHAATNGMNVPRDAEETEIVK